VSGISDAAKAAREKASGSVDPGEHAVAHALTAAERAEFDAMRPYGCIRCGAECDGRGPNPEWCDDCEQAATDDLPAPPVDSIRVKKPPPAR
jgi:hypothetical protein